MWLYLDRMQQNGEQIMTLRGVKKRYHSRERVESDWDINPHIPEGRSLAQDVHLAAWRWVAGVLIQSACTSRTDVRPAKPGAPQAVCVLEKPGDQMLLPGVPPACRCAISGHAPVAITWPQTGVFEIACRQSRWWWSRAELEVKAFVGSTQRVQRVCLTGWIHIPDCFESWIT